MNNIRRGQIINSLSECVTISREALDTIPDLVRVVLHNEMWRHFIVDHLSNEVRFASFREFVEAKMPVGLGTTVEQLLRLCVNDPDLQKEIWEECN